MAKDELDAMKEIYDALEPLDDKTRERVLLWVSHKFDLTVAPPAADPAQAAEQVVVEKAEVTFSTFAELFNAISPRTNAEKALAAGYWLQIHMNEDQFTSQAVNKELLNLGHALANVTDAFSQLQQKKPALAIQLKKSGKSQQARKLYKLTHAGIEEIRKSLTE